MMFSTQCWAEANQTTEEELVSEVQDKRNIFISFSSNFEGFGAARRMREAMRIRYLLSIAPRPRIWETNVITDPATGDTSFMFQFPDGRKPVTLCLTLEDMREARERAKLSLTEAGFDPL
jgi:hypothetical protein